MKRSRKNRKILRAFLQSTLIVSCMLLCVLIGSIFYITYSENHDTAASKTTKPASLHTAVKTDSSQSEPPSPPEKPDPAAEDTPSQKQNTTLLFAGDVYFSDYVLANYHRSGIRSVLSKDLLKEMRKADLMMVNNEFPYSTRGTQAPDKQFTFRIDPSYVSILSESGVDLVTLANNHVLDYGKDALTDTFQTLDKAGIDYVGAGNSLKRAAKPITKK